VLLFCAVATGVLFVLFNLTRVEAELDGRFLFFVPVATGAVALLLIPAIGPVRLRVALYLCLLALPVGKTVKYVVKGRAPAATLPDVACYEMHFIRPHFTIRRNHVGRPPLPLADGRLLVAPPVCAYFAERLPARRDHGAGASGVTAAGTASGLRPHRQSR
jgi:hypothetical protein